MDDIDSNDEVEALREFMATLHSQAIRDGEIKPGLVIDGETGARRRPGRGQADVTRCQPQSKVTQRARAALRDDPPPKRRGRPRKPIAKHFVPETVEAPMHHEWYGKNTVKLQTTYTVHARLEKLDCQTGDHVDLFVADLERLESTIRSPDLAAVGGGGGLLALPESRLMAANRISELKRSIGQGRYDLLIAVIIYGAGPASLHKLGAEQHRLVSYEIRDAVDHLAQFYTPARMLRRRRTWDAASRLVSEMGNRK